MIVTTLGEGNGSLKIPFYLSVADPSLRTAHNLQDTYKVFLCHFVLCPQRCAALEISARKYPNASRTLHAVYSQICFSFCVAKRTIHKSPTPSAPPPLSYYSHVIGQRLLQRPVYGMKHPSSAACEQLRVRFPLRFFSFFWPGNFFRLPSGGL